MFSDFSFLITRIAADYQVNTARLSTAKLLINLTCKKTGTRL